MGKILIAGGAVPFGGWLAKQLLEAGHTVRVTATTAPTTPLPKGAEFVLCGLDHADTYLSRSMWQHCSVLPARFVHVLDSGTAV